MRMLDEYLDLIYSSFASWIKVSDNKSKLTIDDFPYSTGVDEDLTYPHCWQCVTVNNCWFKNEKNKKPDKFDYTQFSFSQIGKSIRGLYHPHCHCKEHSINVPKEKDIELILSKNKINDFFDRKINWFYRWGYQNRDKEEFINTLKQKTIEEYRKGNYIKFKHSRYGFQIDINITIPGKNEKVNREYVIKTCYIVFPNGKLRCTTLVGG